jgi:hypothetical protein
VRKKDLFLSIETKNSKAVIGQLSLESFFSFAKGISKTSEFLLRVKLARYFGYIVLKVSEGKVFGSWEYLIHCLPFLV